MNPPLHDAAARGFDAAAGTYEAARPGYPAEAVERLIGELRLADGRLVVDLGAGTGKLTRELVGRGVRCLALEPVAGMRRTFAEVLPGTPLVAAAAEALPLRAQSVEAVVVAQAFHWFRHEEALRELSRVLRPGGRFALVWNVRDERADWVARLTEIIRPYEGAGGVRIPRHRDGAWRAPLERTELFRKVSEWQTAHLQPMNEERLVGRVASTSFIAALPDEEREQVLNQVRELAEHHPDLAGRERFEFPYVTEVSVYEARRGSDG